MDMGKRKFEYEFAEDKFDSRKKTTVLVEQSSSPFLALPVELVYRILDNLDQFTIFCSARNVCVRLNTITDTYHRYQAPTALNLSSSQIGNKKAQLLADALRNNTTLTTLDLWENLIGETGAQHLADALRINTHFILFELREHIDPRIYDISVYSVVAYIRGLTKLSSIYGSIMASDVSLVSRLYVFDNDLKLGEENFADIVNKNILCLLYNEAGKNAFEDDVFRIFNHIFVFENDYQANVIKILQKYSAKKYLIPDETMLALENVISIPEWFDQVLKVFESMIYNKQSVSEKILQIIADYFYLSHDKKLRDRLFHLLTMVDDNQDVSDEIFDILELEKASLVISSNLSDANHAIVYLFEKTKEGKRLTINGFKALSKVIDNRSKLNEEILKIILNTSNNEQIITDDLIQKLVKRFKPHKVQKYLLEIFENLVKNNQDIPNELSFKSEIGESVKNTTRHRLAMLTS
ncbi:unnamed protein product [Rotaria socialis]